MNLSIARGPRSVHTTGRLFITVLAGICCADGSVAEKRKKRKADKWPEGGVRSCSRRKGSSSLYLEIKPPQHLRALELSPGGPANNVAVKNSSPHIAGEVSKPTETRRVAPTAEEAAERRCVSAAVRDGQPDRCWQPCLFLSCCL